MGSSIESLVKSVARDLGLGLVSIGSEASPQGMYGLKTHPMCVTIDQNTLYGAGSQHAGRGSWDIIGKEEKAHIAVGSGGNQH